MKNTILGFLLGVILVISMAATPIGKSFITFKQATPKYTVSYNGRYPEDFTSNWSKKGYIVQSSASCGYYNTYVVMVKY